MRLSLEKSALIIGTVFVFILHNRHQKENNNSINLVPKYLIHNKVCEYLPKPHFM